MMNLKNRPYSIYAHSKREHKEGVWFRLRSFETMAQAVQSLQGLTKKPKDKRDLIYIILPNQGEQKKVILFKDKYIKDVLKSAK